MDTLSLQNRNKFIYKITGLTILVSSLFFFLNQIYHHSHDIKHLLITYNIKISDILSLLIYILVLFIGGLIWYILLQGFSKSEQPFIISIIIFFIAQFGKYIPGNIGHHIGRIYLCKKYKYNIINVISAMTIENLMPIAISTIFFIYISLTHSLNILNFIKPYFSSARLLLFLLFVLIACVVILYAKKFLSKNINQLKFDGPSLIMGFILTLMNFLAFGTILYLLIKSQDPYAYADILSLTSIFSVSWVLGFITPGAPGGIGVREAILLAFLSPIYGIPITLWITIMLRLVTILGDFLVFSAGIMTHYFLLRNNQFIK